VSCHRVAVLDVDGTPVDSNDAHAEAWVETGRELRAVAVHDDPADLLARYDASPFARG
jgi:beta-phosphoglucomutase-like phosphatase (HAD superfamily)